MLSVISYLCRAVIEAHLVAHLLTQPDPHLMGHPLGYSDGSNPPGLSHTNPAIPAKTWKQTQTCWRRGIDPTHMPFSSSSMVMYLTSHTCFIQVLRQLSGLSAASFTRYDQEGVFLHSLDEFVFVVINRQLSWFKLLCFSPLLWLWHVYGRSSTFLRCLTLYFTSCYYQKIRRILISHYQTLFCRGRSCLQVVSWLH